MNRKIIFRWIKVILLVYSFVGIIIYYLQDKLLLHPTPVDKNFNYHFSGYSDEINLRYDKDTRLNIVRFRPVADTTAKGVVLYFHGNRGNIGRSARHAPDFTKNGYEVWMIDYPGFGKSTGLFTEQRLYDYALQFYRLARTKYKPADIIIYGKSLGTCMASQLAAVRDCKYLVLETPCYSMVSLIQHYLPVYPVEKMFHYHFPNNEYLEKVTAPVLIFHGTSDGIIPYSNARKLLPLLKEKDAFITIEGGYHNDLDKFPLFHRELDSLLSR